jgi:hypothetical protein
VPGGYLDLGLLLQLQVIHHWYQKREPRVNKEGAVSVKVTCLDTNAVYVHLLSSKTGARGQLAIPSYLLLMAICVLHDLPRRLHPPLC